MAAEFQPHHTVPIPAAEQTWHRADLAQPSPALPRAQQSWPGLGTQQWAAPWLSSGFSPPLPAQQARLWEPCAGQPYREGRENACRKTLSKREYFPPFSPLFSMVYRGGSSSSNWIIGILTFKASFQLALPGTEEVVILSTRKVTSMVDLFFLTKKFNKCKPRTVQNSSWQLISSLHYNF